MVQLFVYRGSIYYNNYPPWGSAPVGSRPQVWGIIGSVLTPRVRKYGGHPGFPALITVGGANRFLENLSHGHPQRLIFEAIFEIKVVKHDHIGDLKVFPDSQDHPDHHGSLQHVPGGPEPGHPQRLIF